MKRLILCLAVFSAWMAGAQVLPEAFREIAANPSKAGGIYHMYDENPPAATPAPKGYKPFYISHYGRHGARYIGSNSQYDQVYEFFAGAKADGALTPLGEKFADRYLEMYRLVKGRAGELTGKGAAQHRGIARRMITNYPEVFKGSCLIDARSTIVPRCVLSMENFCDELKLVNPRLRFEKSSGEDNMAVLNPHSLYNKDVTKTDEGYNNKYAWWQPAYKKMCRENTDPETFFSRYFKDWTYVNKYGSPVDKEIQLYYIACSCQCTDDDYDFWDMFTFEEKCLLWEADSYRFFCSKGPDDIQGGRQWAFCWTFAKDIIDGYDKDMAEGRAARLRFGHDITIMSYMTLMDIECWSTPARTPHEAKDLWRDYWVPMGSNIQFVFYRNSKGHVLVRFMDDERDVLFPIESATAPFYDWEELRAYMERRIELAHKIIATTQAPPKTKSRP